MELAGSPLRDNPLLPHTCLVKRGDQQDWTKQMILFLYVVINNCSRLAFSPMNRQLVFSVLSSVDFGQRIQRDDVL